MFFTVLYAEHNLASTLYLPDSLLLQENTLLRVCAFSDYGADSK